MTPDADSVEPLVPAPATSPRRLGQVVAAVLAAAVLGGSLLLWLASDPAGDLENEIIEAFDREWDRVNDPTWCTRGCSTTGHEWHAEDDVDAVTSEIVRIAEAAGIEVANQSVNGTAELIRMGSGDAALEVGVTGPDWPSATAEATGTAIWFTSLSVFDDGERLPVGDSS